MASVEREHSGAARPAAAAGAASAGGRPATRLNRVLWTLLLGVSALAAAEPGPLIGGIAPEAAVRAFVEASNRHDVEQMVAAVDADFRWMQVEGDRVVTEVVGADQLRSWLQGYFQSTPDARSAVGATLWDGRFVSAVETVSYRDAAGVVQRQSATSIYEFGADGRMRAVWYFPAQPLISPNAGSSAAAAADHAPAPDAAEAAVDPTR